MPNHVRNVVKIKNIPKDKLDYILNKLAVKYTTPDYKGGTEEWIMDFDLIIPEPRFKKDCPKDCIVNSESHVEEDGERPWFNWYNFHLGYWGTKWNAYDGYTIIGKTQLTFVFNTAWCAPDKIYEKLFTLGYPMSIRFADEDIGSNCGKIDFKPAGEDGAPEMDIVTSELLPDPVKFARYIWSKY